MTGVSTCATATSCATLTDACVLSRRRRATAAEWPWRVTSLASSTGQISIARVVKRIALSACHFCETSDTESLQGLPEDSAMRLSLVCKPVEEEVAGGWRCARVTRLQNHQSKSCRGRRFAHSTRQRERSVRLRICWNNFYILSFPSFFFSFNVIVTLSLSGS